MRERIEYKEHKLNILVSQIELTYKKTIFFQICNICEDPILITDLREYGEQCVACKKWFCTKRYYGHKDYFESCAFKNILGCFISKNKNDNSNNDSDSYDENDVDLLCLSCAFKHIDKSKDHSICEHLTKSMNEGKLHCNSIIIKNNGFYCEECDAIDNMVIYI